MHRLALAGLLPALFAAAGAAEASVVTEADVLAALDGAHPAVAEKSAAVAVARARVVAAASLENPALGVVREDPSGPVEQTDWTVSWQLPDSDRRLHVEARQEGVTEAEARLAQDLLSLRLTLKAAYADWAVAAARRQHLAAQAERVEALAARQAARAQRGETSGLEAHRLRLAAAGLRARLALADADAAVARGIVQGWVPDLPAGAEPLLPPLPPAPEPAGGHPLERAAQAELAAATLEQQAAGRFVRSPEIAVGWQRQESGTETLDGPILGLSWSVPLFARKQADRALGEARVAAARARLETVRREMDAGRAAATAAYRRLAAALADAAAARAGNEPMVAGAEAAFRHGEATLTDLLETLRAAAESETAALDLHHAALAAYRQLERLAGTADDSDPPPEPTAQEHTP